MADTVLGEITDWIYGQIVGFLGNFFGEMGSMGAEIDCCGIIILLRQLVQAGKSSISWTRWIILP